MDRADVVNELFDDARNLGDLLLHPGWAVLCKYAAKDAAQLFERMAQEADPNKLVAMTREYVQLTKLPQRPERLGVVLKAQAERMQKEAKR